MSEPLPSISPGQRAVIAGRAGSGKSTLANWLLKQSPGHWLILNPKWTKAYSKLPDSVVLKGLKYEKIEREMKRARFVVINPNRIESTPEVMDELVLWVHESYENVGICADELYTLHSNGKAGEGLIALLTRGRELKQSFIGQTQRPAWVSKFVFSESNYIAEMSLNLAEDRKRMYEFIGHPQALEKLPPRQWLWYTAEKDSLRAFGPVPLK